MVDSQMKKSLLLVYTIAALAFLSSGLLGQVAVIANPDVPVDTISKEVLLDYYAGDINTWGNDQPIIVFDLKPRSDVKKSFYEGLGKTTGRMKSIWMRRKLSGEGEPPEALPDEETVLKRVAETSGAIGFLHQAMVNDTVKVLLTFKIDD